MSLTAVDSLGSAATAQTIAVTANGLPVIAHPASATLGVGQTAPIAGISLSETGNTTGELFTVTLTDSNGLLSATGSGVSGAGTKSLTVTGTLGAVNAALVTLTDKDGTAGADTVTIAALDSLGNAATTQTIAITANGLPAIAAPGNLTMGVGQRASVAGISLTETGNTTGELFTVTLSDANGLLSASGGGVSGAGTRNLTVTGAIGAVNAALATLTDTDGTTGAETLSLSARDGFGNTAAQSIAVTVNGLPVIALPASATTGVGQATSIAGISLSETGNTAGELFTVTLADSNGLLSASGSGVSGAGTKNLTVTGTLGAVNAALATLTDRDSVAGTETLSLTATDGFGNAASAQTVGVTVNGLPVIAHPASATLGVGQTAPIAGISLAETGNTAGELFTVTLTDSNGLLSATGSGVSGAGTKNLTVTGTLGAVNAALATLTDRDSVAGTETLSLTATDGFGNASSAQTVGVTVNGLPVIAHPASATLGVGQTAPIAGISLSETGNTTGELFTVTLTDSNGLLSATGSGVSGAGTKNLTVTGTLGAVNAALATLTDRDSVAGTETLSLTATDGFGNAASAQTVGVTVNGLPVIAHPASATLGVGQTAPIAGISLAETGNTAGELFTVTLTDSNGLLSATGSGVSGAGTKNLTVTGTLGAVNAALATLTDRDSVAGTETLSLTATDGFGNAASAQTVGVTVNGLPVIAHPASATLGVGQTAPIAGISLAETGNTAGELFTVTLTDSNGLLSATGSGVSGAGTKNLTVTGTLGAVNAALATLTDRDSVAGTETLSLTATDGFGNAASAQTVGVTVNGLPVIAHPASATLGVGQTAPIAGISLAETGNTAGELFTVTLTDSNGLLSATGSGVSGAGTKNLTVTGTLGAVNAALATLTDRDSVAGTETLSLTATDGFGNAASAQTVGVTVNGLPVIAHPASATLGVGQTAPIAGISLAETGNTAGELFTVTLTDSNGLLSATGSGVSGAGTKNLTVTGTLGAVNAALATLTDRDSVAGTETLSLTATDGFGNAASAQTVGVTVNGLPVIAHPASATLGVGQTAPIAGISLAETGNTAGELFTVTLADSNGLLSASGSGVSGAGTKNLTVTGTLGAVNAALVTLTDKDGTAGADTVTIAALDSLGNAATTQTIAITANGLPAIAAPGNLTMGVGQRASVAGISLTETGNTTGELFTVTLSDANGLLSASGGGVSGAGTRNLTVTGAIGAVNAALATLTDTDGTTGAETLSLSARDGFGNTAAQSIAVTVNRLPVIALPASATTGVGQATSIAGISLSETGNTAGELFTVTLADSNGLLSASGSGVSGAGTKSLTVTGTLGAVNAALATLTDRDSVAGTETLSLTATDGFGNAASAQTVGVTVNGLPVIAHPASATTGVGQATSIAGISLSETGNTTGELFTVTLADSNGLLSATGGGVSGAGTKSLTVTGTLGAVNAALATLTDRDSVAGTETLSLTATDGFGNAASAQTVGVTVNGLPVIAHPASATLGVGQTAPIAGISLSETGNTTGELFTVTLTDSNGLLSATGSGVSGAGTKNLTVTGTLGAVNAALATLTDRDSVAGTETLSLTATDGFGNAASAQTVGVTVNGLPVIAHPASATLGVGQTAPIAGISLAETGNTAGELFTVTLTDSNGLLSATGSGVSGAGTKNLTVTGTLGAVNAALATLTDRDSVAGTETLSLTATDGFGNAASAQTVGVTVNGLPVIAHPASATLGVGQTAPIAGISLAETGNTAGELFTVTLTDSNGLLSATGSGVSGAGTKNLTVTGTLGAVNAALATLTDRDSVAGTETLSLTATDGFGNAASAQTVGVTVNGLPVIAHPASATTGVGKATQIAGISLAETGNTAGELFIVTLADSNGLLSASGSGVSGAGTKSLTVTGTLGAVNAALATLTDRDSVAGTETLSLTATDGFGNAASAQTVGVKVNGLPVIAHPASATTGVGQATQIAGISLSETGNTTGELFTVTLADSNGLLSASGSGVSGAGTKNLTVTGTLGAVNAALATLTDKDSVAGTETLSLTATDGFGNASSAQTVGVTVNGLPVIAHPASATTGVGQATQIAGISLSETGNTAGELFTVTLADSNGLLSATGSGVSGAGTKSLTVTGTLGAVNAALATLTDKDSTAGAETLSLTATDGFGNASSAQTVGVTVNGLPVIAHPASATTELGQAAPIAGISLSETGNTAGELFTVTLADSNGLLSATGSGVSGAGTKSLTVTGTLGVVNAALATLTDTEGAAGATTLSLAATDGFGNIAAGQTIAVTVENPAVPQFEDFSGTIAGSNGTYMVDLGSLMQGSAAGFVSLGVVNAAAGVADTLSGSFAVAGSGAFSNTGFTNFAGLAAGQDDDTLAVSLLTNALGTYSETITLLPQSGTGSTAFALSAQTLTVVGTIVPALPQTYDLTTGPDTITGTAANDTFVATDATLSSRDIINGGGGTNTLLLSGSGVFDLGAPRTLTGIQTVDATEGQASGGGVASSVQTVYLRDGLNVTLNVASGTANAADPNPEAITIYGSDASNTINLGGGSDTVVLGSADETVNGGGGTALVQVTGADAGALINGGSGTTTLEITTAGTVALNAASSNLIVRLDVASNLTLGRMGFISAIGSAGSDTITAMGQGQTLTGGAGADQLFGYGGFGDMFRDTAAGLDGDTIHLFGGSDVIDITDLFAASAKPLTYAGNATAGMLTATDGTHTANISLLGNYSAGQFVLGSDNHGGSLITIVSQ